MSNFFNEFSDKSSCRNSGMCSIDPSSYALEELLLNEIKQIAFYIVKLSDFKDQFPLCGKNMQSDKPDDEIKIMQDAIRALSVIIVNTAFRLDDYTKLIYGLEEQKQIIKTKYLDCCKERKIKYELVENADKLPKSPELTNLLKAGEVIVVEKQKHYEPKKLDLIELIIIFAKTTSINIEKLRHLGYTNPEWNFKILKFLNYANFSSRKIDKIKKKICDFSEVSIQIWKKLIEKLEEKYGKRIENTINLEIKEGKSILVSGSDLDELDKLLDALQEKDINIYTNSTLFSAFGYPHFSKYKNLIGHFGAENAEADFTKFKGPIFTTQNFLQKMDYLRHGTIYTTKIVAPERMIRIDNYDFKPLIESAINSEGFSKNDEKFIEKITLKYNKEKIDDIIKQAQGKELSVIVGSYKKDEIIKRFSTGEIIELESPVEIELLIHILEHAQCDNLNLIFTHCGPNTINILLSTLYANPKKIYFAKCPNSLINPHTTSAMTEEFDVEII